MEALSILNLATAPQAPHSSAGTSSSDKSADASGLPSFAQVVREILVRTTTQNDTQSVQTAHFSSPATSGSRRSISADSRGRQTASTQPPDLSALNLDSLISQSPIVLPAALTECKSQITTTANSGDSQSVAPSLTAASSVLPGAPLSPASTDPIAQFASPAQQDAAPVLPSTSAQTSPVPILPDAKIPGAANQLASPGFPDASASLNDRSVVPLDQHQMNPSSQPSAPPLSSKTIADFQILASMPGAPNGVPIPNLQAQIVQLHPTAPANPSNAADPAFTAAHPATSQATTKAVLASVPLFAALPTDFAFPSSSLKNSPLAPATPQPVVLPANPPSSNHSGSQDSSSSSGSQRSSDTSTTSGSIVSRDAAAFSQVLTIANGAKPDAAPATPNQVPVVSAVSIPSNDRPAPSSAVSSPAAPANPPQPPFHLLDPAANRIVSDAQLVQSSGHSEMRIAMQMEKFGAVELHARVAGDEIGAAITVEKRDAHAALAVELPALQQALSDKQLHVDQIALLHGSPNSTASDAGAQSQAQQGDRGTHRPSATQTFLRDEPGPFALSQSGAETRGIFDIQGRLSVQA